MGDEVVQLYVHDRVGTVTRPVKALKGFRRIHLEPGETRTVEFELTPEKLALLDEDMQWRVEPGLFDVMVGSSSEQLDGVTLEVAPGEMVALLGISMCLLVLKRMIFMN